MKFEELNIDNLILKALYEENYSQPTPIQESAIPLILQGRDLLGCAQTGTGKTAAFAIPTLQILNRSEINNTHKKIRCLIITPTRELAVQIFENFSSYGKYMRLKSCVIFGGVSQKPQEADLKRGVDILIATPGRLNDLINQGFIDLGQVEILILDEADRMLDMGFINDVRKIIKRVPQKRQTLLFSATMPPAILSMANSLLTNPEKVEITPAATTVDAITQKLYYVDYDNKKNLLNHILKDKNIESALIFTRTKHGADKVVKQLEKINILALAIHGNKSQNARQNALSSFKNRELRVLVATDLAARGLDIDELSHVINYDLPNIPETYVHRIGRTGRAGLSGIAISFCDFDEKPFLKDIEKLIGKHIEEAQENPYPLVNNFPKEKTTQSRPPRQPSARKPAGAKNSDVRGKRPTGTGAKPSEARVKHSSFGGSPTATGEARGQRSGFGGAGAKPSEARGKRSSFGGAATKPNEARGQRPSSGNTYFKNNKRSTGK